MAHVSVLGIDLAKQIFHIVGMDDTTDAVSEPLHERSPKTGVLGGEGPSWFFQAQRRIERLSEHVKMFRRRWPVPWRGTSPQTALDLWVSTTPKTPYLQADGQYPYATYAGLDMVAEYVDMTVSGRREARPQPTRG